ncbi:MAG: hypothetical protein ACLTTW_06115 [Coprobacter sp.]
MKKKKISDFKVERVAETGNIGVLDYEQCGYSKYMLLYGAARTAVKGIIIGL